MSSSPVKTYPFFLSHSSFFSTVNPEKDFSFTAILKVSLTLLLNLFLSALSCLSILSWVFLFSCFFFLFSFSLLPFLLVLIASFLTPGEHQLIQFHFTLNAYYDLFNSVYLQVFLRSFYLAGLTTIFCLLIVFPFAFIVSRLSNRIRSVLIFLLIIPFWTSSLIRVYSIIILIRGQGLINRFLIWAHVIHHPFEILYTHEWT